MTFEGRPQTTGRLAIIAGGGMLPHHVADAARLHGEDPFIIALSNEADQDWTGFDHRALGIGNFREITATFRAEGIDRVVLSGGVRRRPEWRDIKPTFKTLAKVPSVLKTLISGGDDAVLKMAIDLIEASGARVIGVQEIVPELLAEVGPLGVLQPNGEDRRDIEVAVEAAVALGRLDVGQGAVAIGGRVVALRGRRVRMPCCGVSRNCAPMAAFPAGARACSSNCASRSRNSVPICRPSVHRPSSALLKRDCPASQWRRAALWCWSARRC